MNIAWPDKSQLFRFVSAGGVGVLLYYIVFYTLTDLVGVWYIASATIGGIVNYSSNFLLHKFWTFKNEDLEKVSSQAGMYVGLATMLYVMNIGLLYALVDRGGLHHLAAQVIVSIIVTIVSFVATRKIFT